MKKLISLLLTAMIAVLLTYCSSSRKAANKTAVITYNQNIKPVIIKSCSPCHTGSGPEEYDVYSTTKNDIDDIIRRIELTPGQHGFMPARRTRLSDSTIALFKQWKTDGLKE